MSDQENVPAVLTKRVERLGNFLKMADVVLADMKEQKFLNGQIEAKVQTLENRILACKAEIAALDEQIRQKKIEAAGSFNSFRDDLTRREQALMKREAELLVSEQNLKARAKQAEELISKAEKAIAPAPAPVEKRGPGRPAKSEAVAVKA